MDLRDYTSLLRRRWRLVAGTMLLCLTVAILATLLQPKTYTARAQLFVAARDQALANDIGSAYTGGLFTQQRVKSYANILQSRRVGELVVLDLGLERSASSVAKNVSASAPSDTVLLNVSVTERTPELAEAIANSISSVFPRLVEEIERPSGGGTSPVRVSVIQRATMPSAPTRPQPRLYVALGLLAGAAFGVAGTFLREALDTSVKSPDEAEALVGAPMLGAISFDPDADKRPLVVRSAPTSSRAEAFRQMRTNLQFIDIEHELHSVVVTSSVPAEGKSTTSCNLAISLADAGVKVVLMEGDLRRPRVAEYMGLENAIGLTNVLLGRVALTDALQPWGEGGLAVLASGPLPPNPSELLGSDAMKGVMSALQEGYDIIIIDAPPLLPVTDAAVLGATASGVLMVVRANRTRREQVKRAAETVEAVGATILGTVLNMVPTRGPDAYAYGYGYGRGKYYDSSRQLARLEGDEVTLARTSDGRRVSIVESHSAVNEEPVGTAIKQSDQEPPQA